MRVSRERRTGDFLLGLMGCWGDRVRITAFLLPLSPFLLVRCGAAGLGLGGWNETRKEWEFWIVCLSPFLLSF